MTSDSTDESLAHPAVVWRPAWSIGEKIQALTTCREGGLSVAPYASMNLGLHVGDDARAVQRNRDQLIEALRLPSEPLWLNQVHGTHIVDVLADALTTTGRQADGAISDSTKNSDRKNVLAILTADCLPVFIADPVDDRIGLLHAGWRGMASGIIERGIKQLGSAPDNIRVALGPAIGPQHFEVGDDVREALMRPGTNDRQAFTRGDKPGKWFCDLYRLAANRVVDMGCPEPMIPDTCTFRDEHLWFSYRRDANKNADQAKDTGRMVSLLWID